jgi:isoquinoline 1-oxidoreductase beta subunit
LISRRRLITLASVAAGGVAVGFAIPTYRSLRSRLSPVPPLGDPGWIVIAPDETVTLHATLAEMGQGVWTALAQIVNDELEADFSRVRVEMVPAWRAYAQPVGFDTSSSSSVQRLFASMRTVGAAARHVLVEAAAKEWKVSVDGCHARNGTVRHEPSDRVATYGSLAARAAGLAPPSAPVLKKREDWRFIGRPIRRIDARPKVNGSARYAMDLQLPGMLVAAIAQAPATASYVATLNRSAALASSGVIRLVELDSIVAVVARDYWSASRGLERAGVSWSSTATPIDTSQLQKSLRAAAQAGIDARAMSPGPAARTVQATYEVPLLAHAQLEPMSAIAHVGRFSAEIWAPTQNASAMQSDVARALRMWAHAVTVHTPLLGGGFGRRLSTDYGIAAALIGRELGTPVKVVWSRAEDFLQGRFRPMSAACLRALLNEDGKPATLEAYVAWLGEVRRLGGLATWPYEVPQRRVDGAGVASDVRVGSWRSVDSSQNVFFRECFIDECAAAAGVDPLRYRKVLLAGNPRALRVLEAVEKMSAWGAGGSARRFLGVAYHDGVGSHCAQVVEIVRTAMDALRVARIFVAVDCGTAVNPDGIRAQIEGGALMGLSAALYEEVSYERGVLRQRNFDTYRVLSIAEAPAVEVHIIETPDMPIGGIGEVGGPPVAPALVNAVFAATGTRVRRLPLSHAGLRSA